MFRSTQLIKLYVALHHANSFTFNSVIGRLCFFIDCRLFYKPVLPFASGIIDDLIVKAKVFGIPAGQILLSF